MKDVVFISYRREDSSTFASILYYELCKHFLTKNIFKDLDTLSPGSDFKKEIETALESSSVLLVLISKNWIRRGNKKTSNRLFDENDFVRHEIRAAIEKNVTIIPVLFENAQLPTPRDLPDILHPLCERQAFTIRPECVIDDITELVEVIRTKRKFKFEDGTLAGGSERLIKDPVNTLKNSFKEGMERWKKDINSLKGFLKKKKSK